MKQKTLLILALSTALILALVFIIQPEPQQTFSSEGQLLPTLKDNLKNINNVTITKPGPELVVKLEKKDKQWVVVNKGSFPANFERVFDLLTNLSEVTLLEKKTKKAEFYDRLGVDGVASDDASSTQVQIFLQGKEKPLDVYIGKTLDNNSGQYARLVDDEQSWLLNKSLLVYNDTQEWLDKSIIDIGIERVKTIEFTDPDGNILLATKDSASQEEFTINNIPENRELIYQSIGNSLANAIAGLRHEDVFTKDEKTFSEEEQPFTSKFQTFDGMAIEVKSLQRDDEFYVALNLGYKNTAELGENAAEETDEEGLIKKEIADLSARLDNWIFQVNDANFKSLTKTIDDLLKVEETEETSE